MGKDSLYFPPSPNPFLFLSFSISVPPSFPSSFSFPTPPLSFLSCILPSLSSLSLVPSLCFPPVYSVSSLFSETYYGFLPISSSFNVPIFSFVLLSSVFFLNPLLIKDGARLASFLLLLLHSSGSDRIVVK